ncbi:pesticin C-terminus-like muramidase [Aliiglaciecola sp. M165]|uniref:pesticin C-terminus-like muramidase n=1 Tax=Aliiglaciecola sp. M165 TaxID=2593649 RepID=UPI00118107F2|nr:pesticin C-terminus-like muramidase [Aliiglaciecola sp. M165]TRY33849.1 hypothetical protein FM019_00900 [Aliiglaciecola sp. M165]
MLRLDDGFSRGRPEFKAEVQHLQRSLNLIGFQMVADGFFGTATQEAVKLIQQSHGLHESGEVDTKTWQVIEQRMVGNIIANENVSQVTPVFNQTQTAPAQNSLLAGFRGDLAWIHAREGHAGKAYWPGGASGVTLDPGFDLGQQDHEELNEQYSNILNADQLSACQHCIGLKGRKAKSHLNRSATLLGIRVSKGQALNIFPTIVHPYWVAICKRFPQLKHENTPHAVQTALLSLAFNRGANNRALAILSSPLSQGDWSGCANLIRSMQQDHALEGIRRRRKMEANLIAPN